MSNFIARPEDGAVWITGASSGIGEALALRLAGLGYNVFATARSAEKLDVLCRKANDLRGSITAKAGDVTDAAQMRAIVEDIMNESDRLALAIFNAGVYLPVHGEQLELEPFHKSFAVNLNGVVNGLVPAVRAMDGLGGGQICVVSSVTGYGGLPTSAAYGATKAALTNMAESLKFDLDKMNITIQIVHPGFVDTPATEQNEFAMPALMQVDDAVERIVNGLKRGRFEITFPRRFTYALKFLGLLPYPLYFRAVKGFTGWSRRPLKRG